MTKSLSDKNKRAFSGPVFIGVILLLIGIPIALLTDWSKYYLGPPSAPNTTLSSVADSGKTESPNNDPAASTQNKTIQGTITFSSTDPSMKRATIGDCPGPHCYTVELGESISWPTRQGSLVQGQVFHIFGTGFIVQEKVTPNGDYVVWLQFDIKGAGIWGARLLHTDGSSEYRWFNPSAQEPDSRPPTKPMSGVSTWGQALLSRHSLSSPRKDGGSGLVIQHRPAAATPSAEIPCLYDRCLL